jgi:hypothetical protein
MPIALTPGEVWTYQLIDDRKPDPDGTRTQKSKLDPNGTKWRCRALSAADERELNDAIVFELDGDAQLYHANRGTTNALVLERGVVGVENFKTSDGRDVPFRLKKLANGREVADLSFLDFLQAKHVTELAMAIEARMRVSEDDKD